MTDTGQFPERGQLDQAGIAPGPPEQAAAPAAFPFPDVTEPDDREDEDLLMPGSHSPWSESTPHRGTPTPAAFAGPEAVAPPAGPEADGAAPGTPVPGAAAPEAAPGAPAAGSASGATPAGGTPSGATPAGRRPLHMGPPLPEQPGTVRPLADRSTAAPQPTPTPPTGPEYLDVAGEALAPGEPGGAPHPGHGVLPAQPGAWQPLPAQQPAAPAAEAGPGQPAASHPAEAPPAGAAQAAAPPAGPQPAAPAAAGPPAGEPRAADVPPADVPPAEAPPAEAVHAEPPQPEPAPAAPAPAEPMPAEALAEAPAADAGAAHPAGPAAPVPGGAGEPAPQAGPAGPGPAAVPEQPGGAAGDAGGAVAAVPAPREESPAASAPAAESGHDAAERDAVHRLMRDRRGAGEGFLPDPIPHDVLLRVLEAAHTAPTVGRAQPWDFVIIRSPETRRTVHDLAVRQREDRARNLPRARAKQLTARATEAILQTPVNIVVTADPTRAARTAVGGGEKPEAAPYSTALAVENLWLAARAEGLGVEWVGFLDERELVEPLGLPAHLDVVAYLCVGYVAETAPGSAPETADDARRPLSWVVHEESYGRRALPGAAPHDLLAETLGQIRPLDAQALGEAWERQRRMTKPAGALGALEVIAAQLCGLTRSCPPTVPEPAAVAVFAGDHGVHAQGVTAWPQEVTAQMVANFLSGGAVCNAFAGQVGAEVCVIDVGVCGELPPLPGLMPRKVRHGTADFTAGPALTREEVLRALEIGIETARDLVAAGNRALLTGEMGVANTTVSAALTAVFTGADPGEVTGRGSGIDDETFARKAAVVRTALERHRPDPADPIAVLEAVGGLEHAALTGLILGGASLRVPVILDGVTAGAAALTARAIAPESVSACIAGHRSAEPGHLAALTALGLRPLVDLDLRLGEGTGALLALPVVQAAARALREVATFDAAGITDKN